MARCIAALRVVVLELVPACTPKTTQVAVRAIRSPVKIRRPCVCSPTPIPKTANASTTSQLVADVDAVSFRALEGPYAVDARRAYWLGKAMPGANTATFHVLNAAFECSADADHAY